MTRPVGGTCVITMANNLSQSSSRVPLSVARAMIVDFDGFTTFLRIGGSATSKLDLYLIG